MDEKLEYQPIEVHEPKKKSFINKFLLWAVIAFYVVGYFVVSSFRYPDRSYVGKALFGYRSKEISPKEVILETLASNYASDWSKKYTSESHLAGQNYGLVEWTRETFEEFGFTSSIDSYEIYVSYPNDHDLNLIKAKTGKVEYKAPLKEDVIDEDPTTKNDTVPTFLAYAANGNVTAEYVYGNYGTIEDFAKLEKAGIDVKGKIVVLRYGAIFRGLKVKFAQEKGAVGVLLYTDPGDDHGITPANGYKQYPHGPARHESSVQRGSVQFLGGIGSAPGDLTTPGYASKPGVDRQDPHASIGKIPALPISYREVKPILEKLNGYGTKIDKSWEGELDGFDYSTGPNEKYTLNLYNDQIYNISTLYNVYGEIEGEKKDEVIIIGNHRDAWIKGGAGDPNSGSAVLLELARALGALKATGYKFKRSIILQSFDGEEYGLLGSTEQGEYFAKKYQRNVVAYLNLDTAVTGKHLNLAASPVLNKILREAAKELDYPEEGVGSLYDHFVKEKNDIIHNLGSGSDYTVYLEHLGIPSADLGFGQGKGDPIYQYHSNYDSYYWMSEFADKGFVYHNLAAKYLSLIVFNLNENEIIDFKLKDYSLDLLKYFDETVKLIPEKWLHKTAKKETWDLYLNYDEEDVELINEVSNGYYTPTSQYPFMDLLLPRQCMHNSVMSMFSTAHHKNSTIGELVNYTLTDLNDLHNVSKIFDAESLSLQTQYDNRDSLYFWQKIKLFFQIKHHNKILQYFERNFLHKKGLHQRSWFKHIIFASGRFTGYAGQTFPGLKEAIEDDDVERFVHWLGIVSKSLRSVSSQLSL